MVKSGACATYWTRWKRGYSGLWRAYVVMVAAYCILSIPEALGDAALDRLVQPWGSILKAIFVLGSLAVLIIFLPVMASGMQMDPASIREQLAIEIEPSIDDIGRALGVKWEDQHITQVAQLLEEGESVEARRRYHDLSGATWDEVNEALANWRTTVTKDKLKILQQVIGGTNVPSERPTV